jgi:hypothetical protein
LFLQRAHQADASFSPSTEEIADIVRICQLVEGMPLGLELAAPWIRSLSCQDIALEIERSMDFLTTPCATCQSATEVCGWWSSRPGNFITFLEQRTAGVKGARQRETLAEITADLDNVRVAWRQAVAIRDAEAVERSAECLFVYYL